MTDVIKIKKNDKQKTQQTCFWPRLMLPAMMRCRLMRFARPPAHSMVFADL